MGRIDMMVHRSNREQSGYTLIELLLYIAMVGILLSAVTVSFGFTTEARLKNQTINEVNDQGTFALEYISQTIRNSTSIAAPVAGASGSTMSLVVPTGALNPTVFSLSGTTLQVKEGTATAVPLTNDRVQVTALSVKNLTRNGTPGIVQVSLTIARVNTVNRNEYNYSKVFTTSMAVRP